MPPKSDWHLETKREIIKVTSSGGINPIPLTFF
jgi:hypothetical protein